MARRSPASARRVLHEPLRRRLQTDRAAGGAAGASAGAASAVEADKEEEAAVVAALLLLLESAVELWTTQRELLGPLHPEGARTLHDVGSCLGALLARAPRALFSCWPGVWDSAGSASHGERRALELHRAIAALYENAPAPGAPLGVS